MQEVEWQLDAVDLRPVERWLQSRQAAHHSEGGEAGAPAAAQSTTDIAYRPQGPRAIADTYFDTPDWRLHRAGLTLRLRSENGAHAVTLKTTEAAVDGLRIRTEIEDPLPSSDLQSLLTSEGRAGAWVRALTGSQPLRPLFSLQSTRQAYAILVGGKLAGEIALDDTQIPLPDDRDPVRLNRVEVEVPADTVEVLRPFLEDLRAACRLTPGTSSKFEAGLLAHGLTPETQPELGPTGIFATQTIGELAFAILRRHFLAFLKNEPGTRVGEDPDALHDMRVAARRMRAALALFSPALPARADRLRQELRWIGGVLGEVRDKDIQLERLVSWADGAEETEVAALRMLSVVLEKRRERARIRLLRALDSRRYVLLVQRITSMLQRGPLLRSMNSRTPALALLPEMIAVHHARVIKLGERIGARSSPQMYHRLRIRCKRLRYAVEFSREVYGAPAADFAEVMVSLQDLLGAHQDAYVAVASLEHLLLGEARRLPPRALYLMGQISQRYTQEAARLRKRYPKAFRQVKGKPWTRLEQVMEKRRPAAWPEAARPEVVAPPGPQGG